MSGQALDEPNLHLGLLAIRNEFVNLSELKHCLDVRRKIHAKSGQVHDLGEVLVQQRYLTPQDLEYLHMLEGAQPPEAPIDIAAIESEFEQHVAELKPGCQFGDYTIDEELGRGGMGIVFRATNKQKDDQRCALKILIGGKDATVRDIERFKKEATVMAPLVHPGIVKIYEVGRHKGLDFIAMEYVDGVSLKEVVGEKALGADISLMAIRSAAEAVGFMHSHGIIHRDIKPENVMLRASDGSSVLMDFGLAGWDKIEILAGRGSIGTPMYQPPEQADVGGPFGKISPASDVYGLGATLYYLLTARHPFLGRSVKEVRDKIKSQPPDPIRAINPAVPPTAEALCLRCLKKRQEERFQSPKELVEQLDNVLGLLCSQNGGEAKARGRLMRRISAAARRRGGATGKGAASPTKSPAAKTPGKTKGRTAKAASARNATRSSVGKVPSKLASGKGRIPRRSQVSDTGPADGGPAPGVVIGLIAAALLGIVLAAVAILR